MPATYAHYRFGSQMLQIMPADMGRAVKRNRRLYDVGLHGPDLFYYHNPAIPNQIRMMGYKFHLQTGREFFSRVCRNLRLEPSEGGQAYLYGVLCHYVLDTACHPTVEKVCREQGVSHTRLETEFDRFLLNRDGKEDPGKVDLSKHIALTGEECRLVSRFYPGADPRSVQRSVRSMAFLRRLLASQGKPQALVANTFCLASQEFADMLHLPEPDPKCAAIQEKLLTCYRQAADRFPEILMQLGAHLTYNAPLGEDFAPIFG